MIKGIKENLLDRKHTQHIIDYSFTKIFQPKFQTENNDNITFTRTYNPNHNTVHSGLDRIKNKELKNLLSKKVLLSTRQLPNLHKLLTIRKLLSLPILKQIK